MKKTPSKKKQKVKKPEVGLSEGDKMSFQVRGRRDEDNRCRKRPYKCWESRGTRVSTLSARGRSGSSSLSPVSSTQSERGIVREADGIRCKTPVSSLSSRITEDVRTKGNKSVFVRVGEGLYTLRKGLKVHSFTGSSSEGVQKVDLERYLNAKYPNMAHGAELDQQVFDEEEETEESSGVVPDDKSLAFNTRPMPILTQGSPLSYLILSSFCCIIPSY